MDALVEFGTLPLGVVNAEGVRCREFRLRPLQTRDSLEVRHGSDRLRIEQAESVSRELADELMGLALLGRRLQIEGVPREAMTLEFMESLWDDDLAEVMKAEGRLQEALARFRGEDAPAADSGPAEDGAALGGGPVDGAAAGASVAGGLGRAQKPEGKGGLCCEGAAPPQAP